MDIGTFVVVAGLPSLMRTREFTDALVPRVEGIARKRRYDEQNLAVLSAGNEPINGWMPTLQALVAATEKASSTDPPFLYFLGHIDSSGQFILNEAERISPANLDAALASSRGTCPTIIIVDGNCAGAFVESLDRAGCVLIALTGPKLRSVALFTELQNATSMGGGPIGKTLLAEPQTGTRISFSHFLFDVVNLGKGIGESFAFASSKIVALEGPVRIQVPEIVTCDETLSRSPTGSAIDSATKQLSDRIPPVITDLTPTQSVDPDGIDLELEVEVFDSRRVETVRAVIGDIGTGNEKALTLNLDEAIGLYHAVIRADDLPSDERESCLLPVAVIARDTSGNLPAPAMTSLLAVVESRAGTCADYGCIGCSPTY